MAVIGCVCAFAFSYEVEDNFGTESHVMLQWTGNRILWYERTKSHQSTADFVIQIVHSSIIQIVHSSINLPKIMMYKIMAEIFLIDFWAF